MVETIDPQSLAQEGMSLYQKQRYLDSAVSFHAARSGLEIAGDWSKAAEMANNCSVAFLQAGQAGDALDELQGIEEFYSEVGDIKRQGITVGNQAAALEAQGRFEDALSAYQRCANLLEISGDDQLRATVMQSLSALQLRTGRKIQALVSMQQGIEGLKKPSLTQKMVKNLLQYPFHMMNKSR